MASLAIAAAVAFVVVLPWIIYYFRMTGSLEYFSRFGLAEDFKEKFPFVKMIFERPDHYYLSHLALITPVYVLSLFTVFDRADHSRRILWFWALLFAVGLFLLFKMNVLGQVFRYLLPALVPLGILTARAVVRYPKVLIPVGSVLLAFQLLTGLVNILAYGRADLVPLWGG